jgi:hypothetical protein
VKSCARQDAGHSGLEARAPQCPSFGRRRFPEIGANFPLRFDGSFDPIKASRRK